MSANAVPVAKEMVEDERVYTSREFSESEHCNGYIESFGVVGRARTWENERDACIDGE